MKFAIPAIVMGVILSGSVANAATCLRASQLRSTDSPDGKSLTLTMNNGQVWQGELKGACTGIKFSGFAWKVDADQICENAQQLRVLQNGGFCTLGKLTLKSPAQPVRN